MCKTGCETGCLTVCTSHKDSLLSDNTLLTNAKIGLHTPWTWFVTCRFSVCFNIERPVWWNQVRLLTFFAPWPQWLMPRHTSSSRYSSSWLDAFFLWSVVWVELLTELNPNTLKSVSTMTIFSTQLLQYLTALCVCLSGSGQERDACSDIVQGNHVDSAVHQKLLPVGEFSEEPASLPGEVL